MYIPAKVIHMHIIVKPFLYSVFFFCYKFFCLFDCEEIESSFIQKHQICMWNSVLIRMYVAVLPITNENEMETQRIQFPSVCVCWSFSLFICFFFFLALHLLHCNHSSSPMLIQSEIYFIFNFILSVQSFNFHATTRKEQNLFFFLYYFIHNLQLLGSLKKQSNKVNGYRNDVRKLKWSKIEIWTKWNFSSLFALAYLFVCYFLTITLSILLIYWIKIAFGLWIIHIRLSI